MRERDTQQPPAKITAPAIPHAYARTRLFGLLDEARRNHRITWVAAPAGAGKTTLIASYVENRNSECLWYHVDSGDRDFGSFFHYLCLAAAVAAPRFRRPLPKLTPEYLGGVTVFARNFFRELSRRLRPPFTLILDNLQELECDAGFHAVLCEALEELPRGIHAILISRSAAPAAFARLRMNRRLEELDGQQLRLNERESRALVRFLGHSPEVTPNEVIDRLHRRCEGWIAGLILMLELSPAPQVTPHRIKASHAQALFDYFATEIFARRAPEVRDFLMQTASFGSFTAEMAEHLSGYAGAAALLADFVRQHHFTERLAESPRSYRYHALFREFLQAQALTTWGAIQLARQQQRAAAILEQSGQSEEALPLYLAAGDAESATRLILARATDLVADGRHATLAALIERLPAASVERDPWLKYWRGVSRSILAPGEARIDLEAAYEQFDAANDPTGLYLAWTAVVESFFVEYRNYLPVDRWIPAFVSLRERHPQFPSTQVEARVLYAATGALQQRFINHPLLPSIATRLEALIEAIPDASQRVLLGLHSLFYYVGLGRVQQASRVLALIRLADTSHVPPVIRLTWCTCAALLEWYLGETRACLRHVDEGLTLVSEHGLPPVLRVALLYQGVHGALARGDTRSANRFLEQMRLLTATGDDIQAAVHRHCAAMAAAHLGDLAAAEELGATSVIVAQRAGVLLGYFANLYANANIALLRGHYARGSHMLATARAIGAEKASRYIEFLCRLSEVAFSPEGADQTSMLVALREALAMSREMGGPAVPWLPHRVLARLYGKALEHDIETEHVKSLIAKLEVAPTDDVLHLDAWPWPTKVYTLGRFGVIANGAPLSFSAKAQRKPLDLLKALIAFGGRHVREDRLTEALWPDADSHRAALALTTTVHRLRRLIGRRALERRERCITLNARTCWVDVWSLERLLATAERTCQSAPPEAIETLAANLFTLYRGAFLSDHDEQSWLLATRERLRDKVIRALGAATDALVRAQRHEQAIRCLQRSLEIEPFIESTYRRLMQVHLARQQRSEALATYRRCRKMLAAQFGLEPSPATEAIGRQIRAS